MREGPKPKIWPPHNKRVTDTRRQERGHVERHSGESVMDTSGRAPAGVVEGGWVPDFGSRYFAEDFPYGLYYIWMLAHQRGIYCPNIDKVYEWGMSKVAGKPIT